MVNGSEGVCNNKAVVFSFGLRFQVKEVRCPNCDFSAMFKCRVINDIVLEVYAILSPSVLVVVAE